MAIFTLILAALAFIGVIVVFAVASHYLCELEKARIEHKYSLISLDTSRQDFKEDLARLNETLDTIEKHHYTRNMSTVKRLSALEFIETFGKNKTVVDLICRSSDYYYIKFTYVGATREIRQLKYTYSNKIITPPPNFEATIKKDTESEAIILITGFKTMWIKVDKTRDEVYEIPTPAEFVAKAEATTTEV